MQKRPHRHFLHHTFEHLFAVTAVLAIALLLGMMGKFLGTPGEEGMLAQTGGSSVGSTTTILGTTAYPVAFSATQQEGGCSSGVTRVKYRFTIQPPEGGYIVLTGPSGMDYIDATMNTLGLDRYLNVGGYTWSGTPRPGYMGTNSGTFTVTDLCASTSGGVLPQTTPPPPPVSATPPPASSSTTTTLPGVSFSAQPGPEAGCETGKPLTPVFFLVTNSAGGNFLISSNTGMNNARLEWGEYPLPNGKYTWTASLKSGYAGVGDLSGSFDINHSCPVVTMPPTTTATTATTLLPIISPTTTIAPAGSTTSSATAPKTPTTGLVPPPPPAPVLTARPQLRLFVDNKPAPTGAVFDTQVVEVRITTSLGEKVGVSLIDAIGGTKVLGRAEKDDLLSRPGSDVWSFSFNTKETAPGSYRLFATAVSRDGKETFSERTAIAIKRDVDTRPALPDAVSSGTMTTSVHVSPEEKKAILERVSDPASCTNEEECRIYCKNLPDTNDTCLKYVQQSLPNFLPERGSLADGVSPLRIEKMLTDLERRPKDIPDIIEKSDDFMKYCADTAHADVCTKALVQNDMSAPETLIAKRADLARSREEEMQLFSERVGARVFVDSDTDGIPDYDEVNIYKTDPNKGDSDGDGFQDGAEILARTNPKGGEVIAPSVTPGGSAGNATDTTKTVSDESVRFENPQIAGIEEPKLLVVSEVAVAELGKDDSGSTTVKKIKLEGRATPNSFVTLYIFSDPIVVTVKADAAGAWTYTLDKELPNGSHQVYSAITDAGGRILAKSAPLPFVKEAAAVSLTASPLPTLASETGFFTGASLYAMIAILVGILGVALSIIGFVVRQKGEQDADLPGI